MTPIDVGLILRPWTLFPGRILYYFTAFCMIDW